VGSVGPQSIPLKEHNMPRVQSPSPIDEFETEFLDGIKRAAGEPVGGSKAWDEPDWSILDDRRGELPEFPIHVLSEACADWVERAAHGAGVTVDHVAVPLIGVASSLIGTARRVMASRSWTEPFTLWTAVVGFSGTGKTPGINASRRALSQIEQGRKSKIAVMQRAHEARAAVAKVTRDLWNAEVKQAVEVGAEPPAMPVEAIDPGPFVAPRLYVSDATIEKLAVLLQVRPEGMLRLTDELSGLFLNMSRYSGGQDNEFWLEAWNGGAYQVQRMNRPAVDLQHLLIGIVGGLQPDKLSRSFQGDLDGMYARFCFAWPVESSYRPLTDDVSEIEPEIINALGRLVDLGGSEGRDATLTVRLVPLSTATREIFEDFRRRVDQQKRALDGRERDWSAKMPAHVLRLAGTLAYLDWAMSPSSPEPAEIGPQFMDAAVQLVGDYFWRHARSALRQIGLSERHANARRALRWILAHKKTEVSSMDIRRDALGQSLDAQQTQQLLDSLTKSGFVRPRAIRTTGRSAQRWDVNPRLHDPDGESGK
jgi:hypothetical protein